MDQNKKRIAEQICQEYEKLYGDRGNLNAHCQEIAERFLPSQSFLFTSPGANQTKGEKRNTQIYDSTGAIALSRFAAILDSLLTPRNQTWHKLTASDPYLAKQRDVALYFEEANRVLFKYRYLPKANFAGQNFMSNEAIGAYGTGTLYIDRLLDEPGLRYKHVHLGEIYFRENHQGIIDTAIRYYPMTARQAVQKWGDKVSKVIADAAAKNPDQEFYFIHCVKPRADHDKNRIDSKGLPFASYYVSTEDKTLIEEGGYSVFPYSVPRYRQVSGEVYGRSPAMEVLPAMKTLNEEKKTVLKQGQRVVDPVLLAHDDGVLDNFSLRAGSLNAGAVTADGRPLVHTLPTGNIAVGKDLMDDERSVIKDAFLVSLFQILIENPQMTATEVLERTREKGMLIAPTLGRIQSEGHGPMIERELSLLAAQGLLPPMPPALLEAEGSYDIVYDSPLNRTQRAEEASGIMRTVETILNVVNVTQNPEPLDHFNWDAIVPEIADIQGVPKRWMNDPKIVAARRSSRQEQMETEQMIQGAPAAAAMIKAQAVAGKGK